MKRVRPQGHATDVMGRLVGVGIVTVATVCPLDRLRLDGEGLAAEGPIGHDGGPPARDGVPSQLEHGRIVPDGAAGSAKGVDQLVRV